MACSNDMDCNYNGRVGYGSLQDGQPPPEPPNLPSTVAVAPRTPVYHLLQMWRRMLPTCVDCGAGKYSGAEKATAATVCVDCGAGKYSESIGGLLECTVSCDGPLGYSQLSTVIE